MLLSTAQMAHFVARGFLSLEAVVPDVVNQQFLGDIGEASPTADSIQGHYGRIMRASTIPLVTPGTPLGEAYVPTSALGQVINGAEVSGAIASLVGSTCVVDHHFLHITFPPEYHPDNAPSHAQPTHQDSTIDPRLTFDIQLFYFPHEITPAMGGTRFIPGTHNRVVNEAAIARYQNVIGQQHAVCPAGTVMIFHKGLWHGGGYNQSDQLRYMFKVRLAPTQRPHWHGEDYDASDPQRPIFWTEGRNERTHLHSILTKPEPWFEADTGRLEFINRIKLWRYITGDDNFDADYLLTRLEYDYL